MDVAEPPNKNASEKVITAEADQSENAKGTIARKEEVIGRALSLSIKSPMHRYINKIISSFLKLMMDDH